MRIRPLVHVLLVLLWTTLLSVNPVAGQRKVSNLTVDPKDTFITHDCVELRIDSAKNSPRPEVEFTIRNTSAPLCKIDPAEFRLLTDAGRQVETVGRDFNLSTLGLHKEKATELLQGAVIHWRIIFVPNDNKGNFQFDERPTAVYYGSTKFRGGSEATIMHARRMFSLGFLTYPNKLGNTLISVATGCHGCRVLGGFERFCPP